MERKGDRNEANGDGDGDGDGLKRRNRRRRERIDGGMEAVGFPYLLQSALMNGEGGEVEKERDAFLCMEVRKVGTI